MPYPLLGQETWRGVLDPKSNPPLLVASCASSTRKSSNGLAMSASTPVPRTVRSSVNWSIVFSVFQTFRGSLTALSTPIFASKASFFSVFRALHVFLCTNPEFRDLSIPLHRFLLKKTPKPKKRSTKLPRI